MNNAKNESTNAVATIAIGEKYQRFAIDLFYSFILYNRFLETDFYIITDTPITIPLRFKNNIKVIVNSNLLYQEEILLNKVFIDKFIPAENILLIDADSLIVGNLKGLFDQLKQELIGIWGVEIKTAEEWRGDIKFILEQNNFQKIYRTNGGVYFFKNNSETEDFFNYCRSLILTYDNNGFSRIYNNLKDDEIILSMACMKFGIHAKPYNSRIKAETMYYSRRYVNVINGDCELYYKNYEFQPTNLLLERKANPLIVCFDRESVDDFDYRLNSIALKFFLFSNFFTRLLIILVISILLKVYYFFKYLKIDLSSIKNSGKIFNH